MGMGRDLYDQQCVKEYLSSNSWLKSRRSALSAAKSVLNNDIGDFPLQETVDLNLNNREYAQKLIKFCNITFFVPWVIAKKYAPKYQ